MFLIKDVLDTVFNEPVFNNSISDLSRNGNAGKLRNPDTDVTHKKDHYIIELDLPGVDKKDVSINYKDKCLHIEAERKKLNEDEASIYQDIFYGKYTKRIALRDDFDIEKIDAKLENGVLSIKVPKLKKKDNSLQIKIS